MPAAGGSASRKDAAARASTPKSKDSKAGAVKTSRRTARNAQTKTEIETSASLDSAARKPNTGSAKVHAAPEANGRGDEGRDARHGIKTSKQAKGDRASKSKQTCDAAPRPNTLVPTNGIHSTERRAKRPLHQNRTVMFLVGATLIGILILGEQTEPPDMSAFEQQFAAGQTSRTGAWSDDSVPPGTSAQSEPAVASVAPPGAPLTGNANSAMHLPHRSELRPIYRRASTIAFQGAGRAQRLGVLQNAFR